MSKRLLIYIAGPFSAPTDEAVAANTRAAAIAGRALMARGHAVICPHSMTFGWDKLLTFGQSRPLVYEDFIEQGLDLLARCDAICVFGPYLSSPGTVRELTRARELGLPVFEYLPEVPVVGAKGADPHPIPRRVLVRPDAYGCLLGLFLLPLRLLGLR